MERRKKRKGQMEERKMIEKDDKEEIFRILNVPFEVGRERETGCVKIH